MEIIERYLTKPIPHGLPRLEGKHFQDISYNPNITIEMILKYSKSGSQGVQNTADWDWLVVSKNVNIAMEIIDKYPDINWNWFGVSFNPNLTIKIIEKYPDKPWIWSAISSHLLGFSTYGKRFRPVIVDSI